jgi:hypothetical protein
VLQGNRERQYPKASTNVIQAKISHQVEYAVKVQCRLDRRKYPTGRKVTVEEMNEVNIKRDVFHGEWNYTIKPNSNH